MIWTAVASLALIEIWAWLKYRDFTCPAVLHNVFWILSLVCATTWDLEAVMDPMSMVVIVCGAVLFQFGFWCSTRVASGSSIPAHAHETLHIDVKDRMLRSLVVSVILASIPALWLLFDYTRHFGGSIYESLSSLFHDDGQNLPPFFSHYRRFVIVLSLAFLSLYWSIDEAERYVLRRYVTALTAIAILFVASWPTRNGVLFYAMPLLISFICTHRLSNRQVFFTMIGAFIGFMAVYYLISKGKYWYLYDQGASPIKVLFTEIRTYLGGSVVAFGNTLQDHVGIYDGKNTFRFFMAIGDAFSGTSSAVQLENEFVCVPDSTLRTNVYTFYDFYIRDFGIAYSLLAQLAVSFIHGTCWRNMKNGDIFHVYMLSMLGYPLVMQFFQDQYLSLLSSWIQSYLVGFLTLKTGIFCRMSSVSQE